MRAAGKGTTKIKADITLTDLDLDEPPDGLITRTFALSAPLDVVLFVLEDAGGAISFSLNFTVDSDGIGGGAIAGQAIAVVTGLIAKAVATSPFKVVGTLGNLFGIGGGEPEPIDEKPVVVSFMPGDTFLTPPTKMALDAIVEKLDDDDEIAITLVAAVGRSDIDCVRRRANPSRDDCLELVESLRRRKARILATRATEKAKARATFATGREAEAEKAASRLAAIDYELGLTERALDRVLQLLKPGAHRQAQRRTRQAAVALGQLRLLEIRRYICDTELEEAADRIVVKRPRFVDPVSDWGQVTISFGRRKAQ
jgi:hypothetical protein